MPDPLAGEQRDPQVEHPRLRRVGQGTHARMIPRPPPEQQISACAMRHAPREHHPAQLGSPRSWCRNADPAPGRSQSRRRSRRRAEPPPTGISPVPAPDGEPRGGEIPVGDDGATAAGRAPPARATLVRATDLPHARHADQVVTVRRIGRRHHVEGRIESTHRCVAAATPASSWSSSVRVPITGETDARRAIGPRAAVGPRCRRRQWRSARRPGAGRRRRGGWP